MAAVVVGSRLQLGDGRPQFNDGVMDVRIRWVLLVEIRLRIALVGTRVAGELQASSSWPMAALTAMRAAFRCPPKSCRGRLQLAAGLAQLVQAFVNADGVCPRATPRRAAAPPRRTPARQRSKTEACELLSLDHRTRRARLPPRRSRKRSTRSCPVGFPAVSLIVKHGFRPIGSGPSPIRISRRVR